METILLHNLYLGDEMPPEKFAKVTVGPFLVELVPDYAEKIRGLGRHGSKSVAWATDETAEADDPRVDVKTVSYFDPSVGGWEVTATATRDPALSPGPSIISRDPIPDGGLWDLCVLLTFITGRRVAKEGQFRQYDPNEYGINACVPIETLWAAAVAWERREELVRQGLAYALLLHNEATSQAMLQISAGLNNTALNILVDKLAAPAATVNRGAKRELKAAVVAVVDTIASLGKSEKEAYKALLGSKIDQGIGSLHDRTRSTCLSGLAS
jgi:hypothetical protein